MKILINLISLFQGGPRTVGIGIIEGIEELLMSKSDLLFYVISPKIDVFIEKLGLIEIKYNQNIIVDFVDYPETKPRFIKKLYLDHFYTAKIAQRYAVDFIFMTANFPSLCSNKPQIVLMHNLHYLIPGNPFSSYSLKLRFALEKQLFKCTIKKKPLYLVQTNFIKRQMELVFKLPSDTIFVNYMIPPKSFLSSSNTNMPPVLSNFKKAIKLFLPAKYHPNKNFGLLKKVAALISERSSSVKFFVTLKEDEYKLWLGQEYYLLKESIINLGEIKYQDIRIYYENIDMVLFPTSAESYGFPYIEAMICNKAIATTNSEFSQELLGTEGYYFELNPESMIKAIDNFLKQPKSISYHTMLSKIPSWSMYIENVISIYKSIKYQ